MLKPYFKDMDTALAWNYLFCLERQSSPPHDCCRYRALAAPHMNGNDWGGGLKLPPLGAVGLCSPSMRAVAARRWPYLLQLGQLLQRLPVLGAYVIRARATRIRVL
jgi:hypothetical protein